MRRDRRVKDVRFSIRAAFRDVRPFHHSLAIGAFAGSRLNRLPIPSIQRSDKQRRQQRLSDACVSASYKQVLSHFDNTSVSRAEIMASAKPSMSAVERLAFSEILKRADPEGTVG